jgi:hypothetical protein
LTFVRPPVMARSARRSSNWAPLSSSAKTVSWFKNVWIWLIWNSNHQCVMSKHVALYIYIHIPL